MARYLQVPAALAVAMVGGFAAFVGAVVTGTIVERRRVEARGLAVAAAVALVVAVGLGVGLGAPRRPIALADFAEVSESIRCAGSHEPCFPYTCAGTFCFVSCRRNSVAGCADGFRCRDGVCRIGDRSAVVGDGDRCAVVDAVACGDYACDLVSGRCLTECDGNGACSGGAVCRNAVCVGVSGGLRPARAGQALLWSASLGGTVFFTILGLGLRVSRASALGVCASLVVAAVLWVAIVATVAPLLALGERQAARTAPTVTSTAAVLGVFGTWVLIGLALVVAAAVASGDSCGSVDDLYRTGAARPRSSGCRPCGGCLLLNLMIGVCGWSAVLVVAIAVLTMARVDVSPSWAAGGGRCSGLTASTCFPYLCDIAEGAAVGSCWERCTRDQHCADAARYYCSDSSCHPRNGILLPTPSPTTNAPRPGASMAAVGSGSADGGGGQTAAEGTVSASGRHLIWVIAGVLLASLLALAALTAHNAWFGRTRSGSGETGSGGSGSSSSDGSRDDGNSATTGSESDGTDRGAAGQSRSDSSMAVSTS